MSLKRAIPPRPRRSNKWWFKLTAISFTIKVVIVVALFFVMRAALP